MWGARATLFSLATRSPNPSPSHSSCEGFLLVLMRPALMSPRPPLHGLLLPYPLNRGGPWVFPPARLPYISPQPPDLRYPSLALCEKMVVALFLSSPAPPTLVIVRPADFVPLVRADSRVPK